MYLNGCKYFLKFPKIVKKIISQHQVSSVDMAGDFTHTPNFGSEILAPVSGKAAKPLGFLGGDNSGISGDWRFKLLLDS